MVKPVWQVESLRKTFFVPIGASAPAGGLWKSITDTEPADQTVKPLLKTTTETGLWQERTLTITSQPGRVDLILSSTPNVIGLPNIGSYADALASFRDLALPANFEQIIRIAFGVAVLSPYDSHEACYEGLGAMLSHVKISPKSREFLYRVNNPTTSSKHNGLHINCISTWAAIKSVIVAMSNSTTSETVSFAVRAELDISTDAESEIASGVNVTPILEEFYALGDKVLNEGPTP